MKLKAIHLFIILIGSLILCGLICSCFPSQEGMKGSRNSTGDVALDVQNAGEKQAKNDYTDYQAELAREGLPTDKDYTPNSNYPASNIGGDPSTWAPTKMSKNVGGDPATYTPTNIDSSNMSSKSGGVMSDIENTFEDAGKDISNLFSGSSNNKTTTKNGYTTTTRSKNQPDYSYTAPAGDTVDVYSRNSQIPWYDTGSKTGAGSGSSSATATSYVGPQGGSATRYVGPQGNSASVINMPSSINRSQIPAGDEDLYILKSQVVPPVCPACPQQTACPRQEPCQPCPPCARCPEPAFDCKKVPNYSAANDQYLPRPVLNDFSSFGM